MNLRMTNRRMLSVMPLAFITLLLAGSAVGGAAYGDRITAAMSFRRMDEACWYAAYNGDYGFAQFLREGGANKNSDMASYVTKHCAKGFYTARMTTPGKYMSAHALSTVTKMGEKVSAYGYCGAPCALLVLKTLPESGYASLSIVNVDYLGVDENFVPDRCFSNRMTALSGIYVPLCGMNSMGLCVADIPLGCGEFGEIHQDASKADLTPTAAVRMLLDNAADTKEAIEYLSRYDMHSSNGTMHHFAISDAEDVSAVVEYIGGEMKVTYTAAATNFFVGNPGLYNSARDDNRGMQLYTNLCDAKELGFESAEALAAKLAQADEFTDSEYKTLWTGVFDREKLTLKLYMGEVTQDAHSFTLEGQKR